MTGVDSLSVVVPVLDEGDNIVPLVREIAAALDSLLPYEIVYVDDGSRDHTPDRLLDARKLSSAMRILRHERSSGQSAAVRSGVAASRHRWIATLDGDGQNDPADIPSLLAAVAADPDLTMVCGIRVHRHDTLVRRWSSRIANSVRSRLLHDGVADTGCGLKLFRRDAFLTLPYFDHIHRFLPAMVQANGGRVACVPVSHRERLRGRSKYGVGNRLWVGVADLLGVLWLRRRSSAPTAREVAPPAVAGMGDAGPDWSLRRTG